MAEGGMGTCPQVFVVDSHSSYVHMPSKKKPRWARVGHRFLLLLMGLTMLGLVVQGFFIYRLYEKTEAFSVYRSHPLYQNMSNPKTSGQQVSVSLGTESWAILSHCIACVGFVSFNSFFLFQGGTIMTRVGSKEMPSERPHPEQIQHRPFAHLMGSNNPVGENNVVQWIHEGGEAITHNMSYNKGRLLVEKEGYYYLYSKLQMNSGVVCSLIQHKVMKDTRAYDKSIELMKSKSFHCRTPKPSDGDDLWNSFLAGIFHLQRGDKIFVTLEDIHKIRPGLADNFMGAFMLFP
ncbi:tumor necrosis factor ligand superfamily member 14-like isoform X1 [Xiphias gladius]|uniref:tumor necrosis factor ligand superfamily member 14-like isoform X1 n=1 Tax=Xiphias gladius TaxID=8245 RepID=UPI001A995F52|nr:tumor necrosis factor ligand superfamily member 14-like isoform X1 [Xiphias gladius]XP_040002611.1 tumor necrosis factor ligand superfamily member 14-like isoform X1 [Xiphias gladius]XP_040002612.1 tumor necrosis factor ligand superfamily member 14-like isoform X1 [Xiphias gladius]XP_040002614.1 tumor necrosis factor ligand superfamily member 14-like isoform X1 [Xiphias gladius]XP_040002615.1 tumor necrosis factor ligand superfamily member 14-like isoform X1 [Xiphias gladius]